MSKIDGDLRVQFIWARFIKFCFSFLKVEFDFGITVPADCVATVFVEIKFILNHLIFVDFYWQCKFYCFDVSCILI